MRWSVPHKPATPTRTTTSCGAAVGVDDRSTRRSRGPCRRAAFIAAPMYSSRRRFAPWRKAVVNRADLPAREPRDEPGAEWPDIARQAVRELPCEPCGRRAPQLEVARAGLRPCREIPRARRPAGVAERCVHDQA